MAEIEKEYNVSEELLKKVAEYRKLREEISALLPDGDVCNCGYNDALETIHYGSSFIEVHDYCLNCGGIQS